MPRVTPDLLEESGLLNPAILRNLTDKLYDKRKLAALEIEAAARNMANDKSRLSQLISFLVQRFVLSSHPNWKKGGLIAIASTAISLGPQLPHFLPEFIIPVVHSLLDDDSRVKYYACESLYNISKLVAGNDPSINNGIALLDRLIKDIVSDTINFPIETFIPLLEETIYAQDSRVRQFILSWIMLLDSVPSTDMLKFLPSYLDGLFHMLSDSEEEIRVRADVALGEFLRSLKMASLEPSSNRSRSGNRKRKAPKVDSNTLESFQNLPKPVEETHSSTSSNKALGNATKSTSATVANDPNVRLDQFSDRSQDSSSNVSNISPRQSSKRGISSTTRGQSIIRFDRMVEIITHHCQSRHQFTKMTALIWLNEFIILATKHQLQPFLPLMVSSVLPALSHSSKDIQLWAATTNANLLLLADHSDNDSIHWTQLLRTLKDQFFSPQVHTREAAVRWVLSLHTKSPEILSQVILSDLSISENSHTTTKVIPNAQSTQFNDNSSESDHFTRSGSGSGSLADTAENPNNIPPLKNIQNINNLIENNSNSTLVDNDAKWAYSSLSQLPFFDSMVRLIKDPSEHISLLAIEVLSHLSNIIPPYWDRFIPGIINLFYNDRKFLKNSGATLLRQMALCIPPSKLYCAFANNITKEYGSVIHGRSQDEEANRLWFSSIFVQTLNLLLLTGDEFAPLRNMLRSVFAQTRVPKDSSAKQQLEEAKQVFFSISFAWCHNAAAALSLCLLTGAYKHAYSLIREFTRLEISVHFLVELDKLVQLLETPIFTHIRLQILEPNTYPYLIRSLFGLMMILPQSSAFHLLKNRLSAASPMSQLQAPESESQSPSPIILIPTDLLLEEFLIIQKRHQTIHTKILALERLRSLDSEYADTQ